MESTLIPFGLLEGVLVRAVEVVNGLACGCLCPGCKTPLIAANKGLKNTPHFRHFSSVDCRAGYESSLHKVAKDLILNRMHLMAPTFEQAINLRADSGQNVRTTVGFNEAMLKADQASAEIDLDGVTPDVVFEISGHRLLIEIRVSRRVDLDKQKRLRALGLSTIEIDLSDMDMRTICDPVLFEQQLLHESGNKHWVHSNRGVQMTSEAMHQIKQEVAALNLAFKAQSESAEKSRQSVRGLSSRETLPYGIIHGAEVAGESRASQIPNVRLDKGELRKKILARAEAIAISIQLCVSEWGGKAMQCKTCLMASPSASTSCRHCGESAYLESICYTHDYANTALARLKCSPRVDQSVERVPVLTFVNEETGELIKEPKH